MFRRLKRDQDKSASRASAPLEDQAASGAQWRAYIETAYRGVLRRDVDAEALEYWQSRMGQGCTAAEMLRELMASPEYRRSNLDFTSLEGGEPGTAADPGNSLLSDSLQHAQPIDKARFERAWQTLPDSPAYTVIGQGEYCRQHRQRFYELVNAVALLTRDKHRPRVLEIGVSAASNLYAELFPEIELELLDRPTAEDYPGFTAARCRAIKGCAAFYPVDLSVPGALADEALAGMSGYDLILFTEVLQVLPVNPQELISGLLQRLAPGGYLYITTDNFLSSAARKLLAAGRNPSPLYPPGEGNWDCHHLFRLYTGSELFSLIAAAGGEQLAFYYSACLDGEGQDHAPDQRGTLVAVARRQRPAATLVADSEQEIIIHIGSDKAGSTAIQAHVYGNRFWLRDRGIYVPESFLGKGNGHAELLENLTAGKLETLVAELAARASAFQRILLSWEGAHFLREPELRLLARHLAPRRVRIIFYLREQGEVIQSGLLQEIKAQNRSVRLAEEAMAPRTPVTRDYYQTLKRWERCFDRLAAEVVYYDRSSFPDGNVVKDLLQRLGCADQDRFSFYEQDINSSLDVASALAVESTLSQAPLQEQEARFFVDTVLLQQKLRGSGERYFLNREQVEQVRAHYRPCNQALVEEYQVSPRLLSDAKPVHVSGQEHFAADIHQQVDAILDGVSELASHPVCFGGLVRGQGLAAHLADGWSRWDERGYWGVAPGSHLRLRPLMSHLSPCHRWVVIRVAGSYHPDAPLTSSVRVNGEELGEYRLGQDDICLPIEKLPEDLHLDVHLDYGPAVVAGQAVFHLEGLGLFLNEVL